MNATLTPLSVLLVEDSASDAGLIVRHLQKAGFEVRHERVIDFDEMRAALGRPAPDVVISDFSLPGFGAAGALDTLRDSGLDIPFIVVSGVIDEASAIELMRSGAHDYLKKDSLGRLGPAVRRELTEAFGRREQRHAAAAVRESEERFRAMADAAPDGIVAINESGVIVFLSRGARAMFGYAEDEAVGQHVTLLMPEEGHAVHVEDAARDAAAEPFTVLGNVREARGRRKDGTIFPMEFAVSKAVVRGQTLLTAVIRDMTGRKAIDSTLRFLAAHTGPVGPDGFFRPLAKFLAEVLNADFVCIDRLSGDSLDAETLAMYTDGHFDDNIVYGLKDTPCGQVVGKEVCSFPKGVSQLFPADAALQALKAEGYVGVTLWGASGAPVGLIALITRRPLPDTALAESILHLVAVRAAGEIERDNAEATLRAHNDDLNRFNHAMVDRELRMIQLKEEVNALRARLGESPPYFADPNPSEQA